MSKLKLIDSQLLDSYQGQEAELLVAEISPNEYQILGSVGYEGQVIPSVSHTDYILAISQDGNTSFEIKKFNNIDEVNNFINSNFQLEEAVKFDSEDYVERNEGNLAFTLQQRHYAVELLSALKVSNLSLTYEGLRYNGVDYECKKILEIQNEFGSEILGFICDDGEVININDTFLDGIFLTEGHKERKFVSEFLIEPYEVEGSLETLEDINLHADYILAISQDGNTCPKILSFSTYEKMMNYLLEGNALCLDYELPYPLEFGHHYAEFNKGQTCVSFDISPIQFQFPKENNQENFCNKQEEEQFRGRRM